MVVKQILVTSLSSGLFKNVFVSNRFQPLGEIVPDSATRIQKTGFEKNIPRSRK